MIMRQSKKKMEGGETENKNRLVRYLQNHWQLYLMILPPIVLLLIFSYGPMYGVIIAFKNYRAIDGIWGSEWADNYGLYNFIRFFKNYNFKECLRNTLVLSVYSLFVTTPCSVFLALCLNYARNTKFRKVVQMITYCPYFISTVVFVGIMKLLLDTRIGILGSTLYKVFGTNLMGSASAFPSVYVWSGVWQGVGYGAIIYLAALSGVDMQLHEAAIIDGATLLQRIRHIDLPTVIPTAVIMLILNMGSILNVGSEKILAMQNQNNINTSEVINTYAYKVSLVSSFPDFSYATAIGLFQSLIGLILLLVTNRIADKISGNGFM